MKILWFCNSPCGSLRRKNQKVLSGGWLISLENEIKKKEKISLSVAYISDSDKTSFHFEDVHYYPIYKPSSKSGILRIISRYKPLKDIDNQLLKKFLQIIQEVKPDLIHIHGTEGPFGLIQDYISDIPIVFSIQGLISPYKEKFFSGISHSDLKKYESLYDKIRRISPLNDFRTFCYMAKREQKYLRNANYIFGRTFWDYNCTLAINPNRKYFICNEILRQPFYIKRWKGFISSSKIQIVSTVSIGFYKGYETLLKAAAILKQYGNINFEWHVAGYNKNTKVLKISEKITSLQSENCNITLHGKIDADELANLLASSDIYVHVSHIENSPNAVCEAMLVGIPVIASSTGGTASILTHEQEGILYQDGDPYVLAGAIIHMTQCPEQAIKYAKAAHKRAILRHDKEIIAQNLIEEYQTILNDFKQVNRS